VFRPDNGQVFTVYILVCLWLHCVNYGSSPRAWKFSSSPESVIFSEWSYL